jgi:hypothetical protein
MTDFATGTSSFENRRLDPRYPAAAVSGITGMRLSPGDVVTLVNISVSGALVEGRSRFVPGTRLTVMFEGPTAPDAVRGRVVRCQVSAIGGSGQLQYQSAIAFDARIELQIDEAPTAASASESAVSDGPQEIALAPAQTATSQAARAPLRNRW